MVMVCKLTAWTPGILCRELSLIVWLKALLLLVVVVRAVPTMSSEILAFNALTPLIMTYIELATPAMTTREKAIIEQAAKNLILAVALWEGLLTAV